MKMTALITLLLPLLLSACSGTGQAPGGNTHKVAAISLSPAIATIQLGQTQTFTATAKDSSGTPLNASFTWASSNPQTATVSSGRAVGLAPGTTAITAAAGGVTSNAATLTVSAQGGGKAEPLHDTIAYATDNGDEIRLIDPDGSNDRHLWAHGLDDPNDVYDVYDVWSMTWSPDATELAFASTHENYCSLYNADIFAVGADGSGYRRVTQAPACADLASYPQGTVRVPVKNSSFDSFSGFLYFQGAPSLQPLNLAPGGSTVVTFENVADFGDGENHLQVATVIVATNREILFSTLVDVKAGGTVTTPEAGVFTPDIFWEAYTPSYRADGSSLAFVLNGNSLFELPVEPGPLEFGSALLAEGANPPDYVDHLAWRPTPETADELLFKGNTFLGSEGVYLVSAGSGSVGEPLVAYDSTETILGLAWLPNASGFVYSVTEGDYFGEDRSANLFSYDFASQQSTRITSLQGDFAGLLSVSPDGERIVFERAAEQVDFGPDLVNPDLWLVDRDGSGLELLVENARAPAWSP